MHCAFKATGRLLTSFVSTPDMLITVVTPSRSCTDARGKTQCRRKRPKAPSRPSSHTERQPNEPRQRHLCHRQLN